MHLIQVGHATSFAQSIDEELSCPEQFFTVTSQWLKEHQPVLSALSYQMGLKLSGDRQAAVVTQTVVGYVLRLIEHAEANFLLAQQLGASNRFSVPPGHRDMGRL